MDKIRSQFFFKFLATLGFLGYLPAPGTMGSIVGFLAVFILFNFIQNIFIRLIIVLFITVFSFYIIKKSYKFFLRSDPCEIIIDEFAGSFYIFWGFNINLKNIILSFIIFRFLDISKKFGISYLEKKFNGALSIIIDDIAAAILTCIILNIINLLI